ncbi:MAG: PD40 domain-containing protein [Acidobacteriaceae bacterium]|nr:PD40 domain-containing protein [Acidobacteriaceae bacterium]
MSRNLWRVDLRAGDAPKQLTASSRVESSPQISPDGRHIAFESDRTGWEEIWTSNADGTHANELTTLRMQRVGSPRWSPDGRRIAFDVLSEHGRAIFVADIAGGAPQQWTAWTSASRPSWSRDGRWIYFADPDPSQADQSHWHVWKISAAADRSLVRVTSDEGFEAHESPDGQSLYYTAGRELRSMPLHGGGAGRRILDPPLQHGWWGVAQDGIYFVDIFSDSTAGTVTSGPKPVYRLNPVSGALSRVATISGSINKDTPDFCVSPDGKTLLYSAVQFSTSQIRMLQGL